MSRTQETGLTGEELAVEILGEEPSPIPTAKEVAARTRALVPGSAEWEEAHASGMKVSPAQATAARLAQVVNLFIAGYSLAEIGEAIGASADDVDRMISGDAARYVRSQPALRTWTRQWISAKYTEMLEADWAHAVDPSKPTMLEHQDRAIRILDRMAKLHGADAPTQTEVKVESAPEAVEEMVRRLAGAQGLDYDTSVFDVIDAEVVHESVEQSHQAELVSGNAADGPQPEDGEGLS